MIDRAPLFQRGYRMKNVLSIAMRPATQLTRKQNVIEATRAIKRALSIERNP